MLCHFKIIIIVFSAVFVISCKNKKVNPYINDMGVEPGFVAMLDTANYTTIRWKDTLQNIGTIKEGETVAIDFRFKNTGNTPLFLYEVKTGCGCTIIETQKDPVYPGDENSLRVKFDSKGQDTIVLKHIYVKTNTKEKVSVLSFAGNILKENLQSRQ